MDPIEPVLNTQENVTLLGGGAVRAERLEEALTFAPRLVAADGGASKALMLGHMPDCVVGDFDSLGDESRARIAPERLFHIPEQDSTDFEKALTRVRAPMIIGVGFTGARIDHELAVYATLARFPDRRCIILGEEDLCFMAPPVLRLPTMPEDRISLFPLGRVTGRSEGLQWPIEGIAFAPDGRVGTSNKADGAQVTLSFDAPGMMVILPRAMLGTDLIGRLVAAPDWDGADWG
ncbi:thiamine diphosphokinase [Celeribacter sp. SCSIO 80788]|uniref:thiamine diphosphokinase n=1 Tax=Celeribacter sp. SCSIO 80788 TaxID=3117013 RepID=UPI003DA2112F